MSYPCTVNAFAGTPQMSTGMPVEVLSAKPGHSYISYYKLDIDIHRCASRPLYPEADRKSWHALWDKMSLALSSCETSRRNQPNVHEVKKLSNSGDWHGAQLTLIIAGHWQVSHLPRSDRALLSAGSCTSDWQAPPPPPTAATCQQSSSETESARLPDVRAIVQ